jgi:hypothetical protein
MPSPKNAPTRTWPFSASSVAVEVELEAMVSAKLGMGMPILYRPDADWGRGMAEGVVGVGEATSDALRRGVMAVPDMAVGRAAATGGCGWASGDTGRVGGEDDG